MSQLRCNRCWEVLAETACVTSCSHIYCLKDAREIFARSSECPSCETTLDRNRDLCQIKMDGEFAFPPLWGLSPMRIMKIATDAVEFWQYQKKAEIQKLQHSKAAKEKKFRNIEQGLKRKLMEAENERNTLLHERNTAKEDCRLLQKQNCALKEENKEKSRMYQKYDEVFRQVSGGSRPLAIMPASKTTKPNHPAPRSPSFDTLAASSHRISTPLFVSGSDRNLQKSHESEAASLSRGGVQKAPASGDRFAIMRRGLTTPVQSKEVASPSTHRDSFSQQSPNALLDPHQGRSSPGASHLHTPLQTPLQRKDTSHDLSRSVPRGVQSFDARPSPAGTIRRPGFPGGMRLRGLFATKPTPRQSPADGFEPPAR
eukprot:g12076.t1